MLFDMTKNSEAREKAYKQKNSERTRIIPQFSQTLLGCLYIIIECSLFFQNKGESMARFHDNANKYDRYKRRRKRGNNNADWSATSIALTLTIVTMLVILLGVWQLYKAVMKQQQQQQQQFEYTTSSGNELSESYAADIDHMIHESSSNNNNNNNDKAHTRIDHGDRKFIIFHQIGDGQGAGNVMHGLLAVHLLGDEFSRTICISNHYESFRFAFEPIDPVAVKHCPDILERHSKEPPDTHPEQTIEMLNYRVTPLNECTLKEMMSSSKRVLHVTANTYPRWPKIPQHVNFFAFYKPKPILLEILPYPKADPPPIVVHLRHPDTEGVDRRKGVTEADLRALGQFLPVDASQNSPFLVTNNVEWFNYFRDEYGWSHPFWIIVMHSEFGMMWDERRTEPPQGMSHDKRIRLAKYQHIRKQVGAARLEWLQLWCDFYTLLKAQKVYHTFSDFSLSAVHWQGTWSRTYDGLDEKGTMLLLEENWIADGESPRLIDREKQDLRNCDEPWRVEY